MFKIKEASYGCFRRFCRMLTEFQEEYLFEFLSLSLIQMVETFELRREGLSEPELLQLSNDCLNNMLSLWNTVLSVDCRSLEELKQIFN